MVRDVRGVRGETGDGRGETGDGSLATRGTRGMDGVQRATLHQRFNGATGLTLRTDRQMSCSARQYPIRDMKMQPHLSMIYLITACPR